MMLMSDGVEIHVTYTFSSRSRLSYVYLLIPHVHVECFLCVRPWTRQRDRDVSRRQTQGFASEQ